MKIKPSNPAKPKVNFERVCVLAGRMEYDPPPHATACLSRIHGHMTGGKAEELVSQEQAEWVTVPWTTRRGKQEHMRVPAIRLQKKKSWKGRLSGETGAKVKVMQLVN
jgi:hypothetical protein